MVTPWINSLLRAYFRVQAMIAFPMGLFVTEVVLEWWEVAAGCSMCAAFTVLAPFFLDKPVYKGNIAKADFLPWFASWPVAMFWCGLASFCAWMGIAVRALVTGRLSIQVLAFVALQGWWVWLIYKGKLKRWTSQSA